MRPWEQSELGWAEMGRETKRLLRRARRRPGVVFLITLLVTVLAVVQEYRKQREYPQTIVLSATESEQTLDNIVYTNRHLTDYVYYAVFTDRTLFELMDKWEYRTDLTEKNPRLRVESFRDLIDVEVYKNEFTEPRYPNMPPRSARIAIEFRYKDPDTALAIARDLGLQVIKRDGENRRDRLAGEQKEANAVVAYAEGHLNRITRDLEAARDDADSQIGDQGDALVRMIGGEQAQLHAIQQLKEANEMKRRLERATAADQQSLELRYDQADWGAPKLLVDRIAAVARSGATVFFAMLLLIALLVAAFDTKVYEPEDVERLGFRMFGHLRLDKR